MKNNKKTQSNRYSREYCKLWNLNKNINPITKRKITSSGTIYKKFKQDCVFYDIKVNDKNTNLKNKIIKDKTTKDKSKNLKNKTIKDKTTKDKSTNFKSKNIKDKSTNIKNKNIKDKSINLKDKTKDKNTNLKNKTIIENTNLNNKTSNKDKSINRNEKELIEYLKNPKIPKLVEKITQVGINHYKNNLFDREDYRLANTTGGGRKSETWIEETLDKSEKDLIKEFSKLDAPKTWTVRNINKCFNYVKKSKKNNDLPIFYIVKNFGINYLNEYEIGKDSIVQLASQFNFLESHNNEKVPINFYAYDYTQGPMGCIEALASTLHRASSEENGKLPNAFSNIFKENVSKFYKNGYLEIFKLSIKEQKELYNLLKQNISKLIILPQWVKCEASGSYQLQVFSAAPSFQNQKRVSINTTAGKITNLLVTKQYEAIAKLAVIRSMETKNKVPLHLTLIGQGAFNNPIEIIKNSLEIISKILKGIDSVKVFIHVFGQKAEEIIKLSVNNSLYKFEGMSAENFKKLSN